MNFEYKKIPSKKILIKEHKITKVFEKHIGEFTGAPYVVCVDSCTSALFCCFNLRRPQKIVLPENTYIGVYTAAHFNNIKVIFKNIEWDDSYGVPPTNIIDSARRFQKGMYVKNTLMCVSFGHKKILNIGKGGAILLDNYEDYKKLLRIRNCGKDVNLPLHKNIYDLIGLNMVLPPDLSRKGIGILRKIKNKNYKLKKEFYGNLREQT